MANRALNTHGLSFLVADSNPFLSRICQSILRGFGATKVSETRDAPETTTFLKQQHVDLVLCDVHLPPDGGLALTEMIRKDATCDYRTIPILILTNDTRASIVKSARDAGANMVVAKPISAAALFDRLTWIAFTQRKFIDVPSYFGPDRRFKIEGFPNGVGRRKGDKEQEVMAESGPAMSQSEIDSLFSVARSG